MRPAMGARGGAARGALIGLLLVLLTGNGKVSAGVYSGGSRDNWLPSQAEHVTAAVDVTEPYFDQTPRNVSALAGKNAYLACRVRQLGNKTVSWIRHRDLHILTVGSYTYTSDQRFQASHYKDTSEWTLQVKWAQTRDAGMYECQVSTQPVRSYFVYLAIVGKDPRPLGPQPRWGPPPPPHWPSSSLHEEIYHTMFSDQAVPTATILGGPDLHVDKGSTINLTCTIKFSPEPPANIFWHHQDETISLDSSRGGIAVVTEKGEITTSRLLIQNADLADSGMYSCSPSNADEASVRVHVLNEEMPAAMQTGSAGHPSSARNILQLMVLSALYWHLSLRLQLSR